MPWAGGLWRTSAALIRRVIDGMQAAPGGAEISFNSDNQLSHSTAPALA